MTARTDIYNKMFPEGTRFLTTEQRKKRMKQLGYLKMACSILFVMCIVTALFGTMIEAIRPYTHYFLFAAVSFMVIKKIIAVIAELHINAEIRNEYYEKSVSDYKKILEEMDKTEEQKGPDGEVNESTDSN